MIKVPLAGPTIYTERVVDPTLCDPSYYKKSVFGVNLLPPAYAAKSRSNQGVKIRRKRIALLVVLLICWGTITVTAGSAIAGGIASHRYQSKIEMMEEAHERELRKLHSLLDEATEEPQYYDRAYVDESYIATESLWAPVVDRARDGHPGRIPEIPKT